MRNLGLTSEPDFGGKPGAPAAVEAAAAALRNRLKVDPVRDSSLVQLRISDYDPKRAKKIADTLTNTYIDENLQSAIESSGQAVVWLNGQLDHVEKELEETENASISSRRRTSSRARRSTTRRTSCACR